MRTMRQETAVLALTTLAARAFRVSSIGRSRTRSAAMRDNVATRSSSNACSRVRSVMSWATLTSVRLPSRWIKVALTSTSSSVPSLRMYFLSPTEGFPCSRTRRMLASIIVDRLTAHLLQRVRLDHREPGGVHLQQGTVHAENLDAFRLRLDNRSQATLAPGQGCFGLFALSDVAGDPNDRVFEHRRDGPLEPHFPAIHHQAVLETQTLARPQHAPDVAEELIGLLGGEDLMQRLSDYLGYRPV